MDYRRPQSRGHSDGRDYIRGASHDRGPSGRPGLLGHAPLDLMSQDDLDLGHYDEERGGDKWMTDTPTNTILLRGLPKNIDENDVRR